MIKPQNKHLIVRDQKEDQVGGLVKTDSMIHQDKFIADVIYVGDDSEYKVGDQIVYDGLQGTEFPEVDEESKGLIIIRELDVLALIK